MQTYQVNVYNNGDTEWFQNGKRHRLNGPAIEFADGNEYYYLDGVELSQKDYIQKLNNSKKLNKILIIIKTTNTNLIFK